jgi:NAD(P)-dependent dehydrogenase (short-subunit alcohol dehydrogenase family)
MPNLSGKTAIVTGAGQGIGKAIAITLAKAGADIVAGELVKERIAGTIAEVEKLQRKALGVQFDVRDRGQVDNLVAEAMKKFGKIDIVVNNAGNDIVRDLVDMSDEEWDFQINVNLRGPFYMCRSALPHMIKAGNGGAIVNIASIAGYISYPKGAAYAAAKAGVMGMTRALASEVAKHKIRVNAVAPGAIDTPLLHEVLDAMSVGQKTSLTGGAVLGRLGRPEEIADAVAFLSSDEASYITGDTMCVGGGLFMH